MNRCLNRVTNTNRCGIVTRQPSLLAHSKPFSCPKNKVLQKCCTHTPLFYNNNLEQMRKVFGFSSSGAQLASPSVTIPLVYIVFSRQSPPQEDATATTNIAGKKFSHLLRLGSSASSSLSMQRQRIVRRESAKKRIGYYNGIRGFLASTSPRRRPLFSFHNHAHTYRHALPGANKSRKNRKRCRRRPVFISGT